MRKGSAYFLAALALAWAFPGATACRAQAGPFAFAVRGGVGAPVGDFRKGAGSWAGEASAGPMLGMGFTFPLPGPLGAYLGFSQSRFGCPEGVCRPGKGWVSTGFDGALRFVMGRRRLRPWIQAGVHTARVETSLAIDPGGGKRVSDRGVGLTMSGGMLLGVGERTSLSTGIRYSGVDVDFPKVGTLMMRYLGVDLGLVLGF